MLQEIQQNNKFFLDMHEPKIISRSIVLVDNIIGTAKFIPNQSIQVNNPSNPFQSLNSEIALASIMEKATGTYQEPTVPQEQTFQSQFVFDDIVFKCLSLPPKFIVQQNSSSESSDKLQKIFKAIFSKAPKVEAAVGIGAVGINFELFIPNENLDVKPKIFQQKILTDLDSMNITLVYKITANCNFNLTIADADYEEKKGIYFKVNFTTTLNDDIKIKDIVEKEGKYLQDAKKKIKELLSDNVSS